MRTQVFGRGTRRVVIQPGALVTIGGYAVASWENGHWVPCPKPYIGHHPATLAKTLATVFNGFAWPDLLAVGRAFADCALWADSEDGTRPRVTDQLQGVGMSLAAYLAQLQPGAVAAAIERRGLADFGHDLFLTARGHGVGFGDRKELDPGDVGDVLTDAVRGWHLETEQHRGYMTAYARVTP